MRIDSADFKDIGNQISLRLDANYRYFFDKMKATTWPANESCLLSDVLSPLKSEKLNKGELENSEYLVDLANIDRRYNHLSNVELISEIGSDKNVLKNGDIVIPKLQPRMGNIFTNSGHHRYAASSELIEYKCDDNIYDVNFLFYILTHPHFQQSLLYSESGKTHRRVAPDDLLKYIIPKVDKKTQEEILKQIKPFENEISDVRSKVKSITQTINEEITKKFDIDFFHADMLQNDLIYNSNLVETSNEELKFDISLKYRNIFREKIFYKTRFSWIPLGKIVTVKGGKRLPKGEDVVPEDTGYRYIRVDDLDKLGRFDIDNIQFISKENHNVIANYIANAGDILLTIVGATVGKCGVLPEELDGENISENFARLIIKDTNKYRSLYILYILMSKIGQYQINEYKGRGSQGKLAIFRIKKIQIPDISLERQDDIIKDIHNEVKDQRKYIDQMNSLRKRIDDIILSSLKGSRGINSV